MYHILHIFAMITMYLVLTYMQITLYVFSQHYIPCAAIIHFFLVLLLSGNIELNPILAIWLSALFNIRYILEPLHSAAVEMKTKNTVILQLHNN